jgi:hypothetical protein
MTLSNVAGAVFFHAELRVGRATMRGRARLSKANPFIPVVLLWIGAFVRDRSIFF